MRAFHWHHQHVLALICRRFLLWGPSYTHCCRALTVALAGLLVSICVRVFVVAPIVSHLHCSRPYSLLFVGDDLARAQLHVVQHNVPFRSRHDCMRRRPTVG